LQRIATNEIASFYIYNRLRHGFFLVPQSGQRPEWAKADFRVTMKDFEIKKTVVIVSLLYKTNRFHVAVRQFSNRSQRKSKEHQPLFRSITELTQGNLESIG